MKNRLFFGFVFVFVFVFTQVNAENITYSLSKEYLKKIVEQTLMLKEDGMSKDQIVEKVFETNSKFVEIDSIVQKNKSIDDDKNDKKDLLNKSSQAKVNFGQIKKTLREGDKGEEVKALQEALNKIAKEYGLKFDVLITDGSFGPKTVQVVKMIQAYKELKADGVVGPQTISELQKFLEKDDSMKIKNEN